MSEQRCVRCGEPRSDRVHFSDDEVRALNLSQKVGFADFKTLHVFVGEAMAGDRLDEPSHADLTDGH